MTRHARVEYCGTTSAVPNDAFYWSHRWRATRAAHLRMFPLCAVCAAIGVQTLGTDVDHITAKERLLDPYDHASLRTLCKQHHSQKTILTEGAHRKGRKRFQVIGPDGWPIPYGDV